MLNSQYAQSMKQKNFFLLPNAIFELELNEYEFYIYAYLIRIENRRTYQCVASYPNIAKALGISINTVAKYVRALEERGLIRTERTEIVTKDGRKRNGCLLYHILPMQQALDYCREQRLAQLSLMTEKQKAKAKAEKMGVEFVPSDDGQCA